MSPIGYIVVAIVSVSLTLSPIQETPPTEPVVVMQAEPVKKEKKKSCIETETCTVKDNPKKCNLDTQWMWGDGSCHDKAPSVSKTTPAKVAPVSGSCRDWMKQAGITDMETAYKLIMKESGCNPNAVNPSSGACGIGQQLPCGKWSHAWNDPVGGMIDMQNYVFNRYGSWSAAWSHSQAHGWY